MLKTKSVNRLIANALILFTGIMLFEPLQAGTNDIIFSTAPTQSPEETLKNYQPLADYLSKVTGKHVIVKPAKNFVEYSSKMRAGEYDMLFDGPQFVKYRIEKQDHVLLAKQKGNLHFAVVVRKNSGVKNLKDLTLKRVCSPSTPHLGTLAFLDLFANPFRQPDIIPVQSFQEAMDCVTRGDATAAVVRDKFWNKVADKQDLKVVYMTERRLPGRGITISKKIDIETR